jgi:GAF domain-containing protein
MGEAMDADAAYIYRDTSGSAEGVTRPQRLFRWIKDPVQDPGYNRDGGLLFPAMWSERLASGNWIAGPRTRFSRAEQRVLDDRGIQSVLIVPIQVKGMYWGFIGCSNLHAEDEWGESEIDILMTLAATIGLLLERENPAIVP